MGSGSDLGLTGDSPSVTGIPSYPTPPLLGQSEISHLWGTSKADYRPWTAKPEFEPWLSSVLLGKLEQVSPVKFSTQGSFKRRHEELLHKKLKSPRIA